MFNTYSLEEMRPKIEVEYRTAPNMLEDGSLDLVPENAVGARVSQLFPTVTTKGNFRMHSSFYNIYVGKKISINEIMKNTKSSKTKRLLKEYESKGYWNIVLLTYNDNSEEIRPLGVGEEVLSSKQELKEMLQLIKNAYYSVDYDIRNSNEEIDRAAKK